MTSTTNKIHSRYDAEHDINPDPKAPRVTWAEEGLADDIDKLFEKIEKLEKMLKEHLEEQSDEDWSVDNNRLADSTKQAKRNAPTHSR